jgi:6-phosphofructokinase
MGSSPNAIVAQSGGPTAVINSSACGVIQEAKKSGKISRVIGAVNGILGVLKEDLFNLSAEKGETIEALKQTPAAAFGSCRYKLKSLEDSKADFDRVLDVFKAHNIRYFF